VSRLSTADRQRTRWSKSTDGTNHVTLDGQTAVCGESIKPETVNPFLQIDSVPVRVCATCRAAVAI
jgi:hypothetical protein